MKNDDIKELQEYIIEHGIDEFEFKSFNGEDLLLIGSPNITYYHKVEINFMSVDFINCPIRYWSSKPIRLANLEERKFYEQKTQIEDEDLMFILENDFKDIFFVICEKFEYTFI
ncbi:hypothetical protein [Chengkuizengella axinellae]|uniref:Uncharacterized protein n=1 Tax=Chengkuizengella axinellae TaxID=3064388 RepID=A0ABT9J3I4_9BACL|nr:hypothetical protein [Chengkuizengella sp. 2205SS18-9]MDP5276158.1 hypothetical protein [Chengkuizengella sp. 2205SS18-9]